MSPKGPRVTLYSGPGCAYCRQARDFLKKQGVSFQELDVSRSPKARKQLERMGSRGVPVILIGDQRIDGFNAAQLNKALKTAGLE